MSQEKEQYGNPNEYARDMHDRANLAADHEDIGKLEERECIRRRVEEMRGKVDSDAGVWDSGFTFACNEMLAIIDKGEEGE